MTIKRLDHVSVAVDDLAAVIAFFTALGMTIEGETRSRFFDSIPWLATILLFAPRSCQAY
jgi:catechol 2,3-dioxygenase-like lactoylglutathione lyase family enzyme